MILEKEVNSNYISIMDGDGIVTIEMFKVDVKALIEVLKNNNFERKEILFTMNDGSLLKLYLNNDDELITINSRLILDDDIESSYFHEFEIEGIEINTWLEIINYIEEN